MKGLVGKLLCKDFGLFRSAVTTDVAAAACILCADCLIAEANIHLLRAHSLKTNQSLNGR